ncbi:MAG: MFS transporter [Chloroflexi bacterium]|nr:MFS transporter [Chloroflexota bacterium]
MAHAHHHAAPSVVEGRTGFRRGAAFIIGGLSSGHGVFHWIAQSFIVVLPEVRDLLLAGNTFAAGSIQGVREIASGVVALPGGVLTDALRRYWGWVMAVCMALFGFGWLLMAAAGWQLPGSSWLTSADAGAAGTTFNTAGYVLLLIGMAVVAIAASVWHLPAMAALSSHFTHRRGSVLTFHGVGGNIGDVIGPFLTGILLLTLTWQAIITIYAAVPIFLAFLVFWAFRDIGQRAQAAVEERATSTMQTQIAETRLLIRNPRVWGITVVAGLRGMAYIGFITVLPFYLADVLGLKSGGSEADGSGLADFLRLDAFGEGVAVRGGLIALLVLVGIFASPVMGYLSDRFGRKIVLVPGILFLAVVTILMVPYGGNLATMTVLLAALGLFLYSDQPILTAAAMDIVREGTAATTLGLLSTSRFVLSAASPFIATWLYQIHPDNLFYYTAALYLAAAVILALVRLPQLAPVEDHHDGHGHHDDHGHHDEHGDGHHDDHGQGHGGHDDHGHRHH